MLCTLVLVNGMRPDSTKTCKLQVISGCYWVLLARPGAELALEQKTMAGENGGGASRLEYPCGSGGSASLWKVRMISVTD